jgi:hypothetical protein
MKFSVNKAQILFKNLRVELEVKQAELVAP